MKLLKGILYLSYLLALDKNAGKYQMKKLNCAFILILNTKQIVG
jgi:hypothetical protein